jgi:hypothetical protein
MKIISIINVKSAKVKVFIKTNKIFLQKKDMTRRCRPHFFIYHIPTNEINCRQTTKL